MTSSHRLLVATAIVLGAAAPAHSQDPAEKPKSAAEKPSRQELRAGLTAKQSQEAVKYAAPAMKELRKKTEGAQEPAADRREFVVGVERFKDKKSSAGNADSPAKAVVTYYRYFDDLTVTAVVDLETGKTTSLDAAQHVRTPLSSEEYEAAKALAKEKSEEVKALFEKYGDKLSVYPQYSQYQPEGDPRNHRVVHLTYRVGKRDLSAPRPVVDLTTMTVDVPKPNE